MNNTKSNVLFSMTALAEASYTLFRNTKGQSQIALHGAHMNEKSDSMEKKSTPTPGAMRATIITSQLPVEHWHAHLNDPTIADAILDRVVHASHRIDLKGESMRKKQAKLD